MEAWWRIVVDSAGRIDAVAVVDILLLTCLIYQIWCMIEGTRGRQLTQGVFVLILVYLVSRPLPVLHYVLGTAMQPAVIALVILFQPELRSALEQIGRIRPGRSRPGQAVLEALFDAVDHSSVNHIGALIAIEGTTGLSDVAATGTILDAQLTPELLSSVFFPNSALHDGGVILRGDRVLAAGCYFPSTVNPDVPRTLGMRHRAALGMSEHADAVVIVVSEETGGVSLAVGGQLSRNLRMPELRERFRQLFSTEWTLNLAQLWRRRP